MPGSRQAKAIAGIITPSYNRADVIGPAVRSVLAQTHQDFEIIVIDDGSTEDVSAAAADRNVPNLRLLSQPNNKGATVARNTRIRHSAGCYIAFSTLPLTGSSRASPKSFPRSPNGKVGAPVQSKQAVGAPRVRLVVDGAGRLSAAARHLQEGCR